MPKIHDELKTITQICYITDDLDKMSDWFCDTFGFDMPVENQAAPPEIAKATYLGKPANVSCRIRIFKFSNIDFELCEPGPEPSAWRDYLEKHGPGCHHIAFRTEDMAAQNAYFEGKSHVLLQNGEFEGGRYAYHDTQADLGSLVELLERDA